MKKRIWIFVSFLGIFIQANAGSVRLVNDSPTQLRAVIRGADGSYLGEAVIMPQHLSTWVDSYGRVGAGNVGGLEQDASRSLTPYTVTWYCMDGGDYSFCSNVATGSTVSSQTCEGARICKKKTKKQKEENAAEDQGDQQNEGDQDQ